MAYFDRFNRQIYEKIKTAIVRFAVQVQVSNFKRKLFYLASKVRPYHFFRDQTWGKLFDIRIGSFFIYIQTRRDLTFGPTFKITIW